MQNAEMKNVFHSILCLSEKGMDYNMTFFHNAKIRNAVKAYNLAESADITPVSFSAEFETKMEKFIHQKQRSHDLRVFSLRLAAAVVSVALFGSWMFFMLRQQDPSDFAVTSTETPVVTEPEISGTINDANSHPNTTNENPALGAFGNTSGNISNGAFTAQDRDSVYYVLPTHPEYEMRMGDLIKTKADGSARSVLYSGDRPHGLNIVDGWVYYIASFDGQIYKMREDGTDSTLITSANTQSGFTRGYTTLNLSVVEVMVVVDNYIYCRVRYPADIPNLDRTKGIFRIELGSGEAEKLLQLDEQTSGFSVHDGWIYYSIFINDASEAFRIRTDGTENTKIADVRLYSINIENDKIYYISGDWLYIHRMDLDGGNPECLSDGIMALKINVVGDWIYCANYSSLFKVKTDGTFIMMLYNFPFSNTVDVNVINDWIYVTGDGFSMFRIRTDGSEFQEV